MDLALGGRWIFLNIVRGNKLSGATFWSDEALEIERCNRMRSGGVGGVGKLGSKRA